MKKFVFLLLFALLLAFCASAIDLDSWVGANAKENKNENGFIYRIEDGNAILFGYDGKEMYITLPETIENCPVTEVRHFYGISKDNKDGSYFHSGLTDHEVFVAPISLIQSITVPKTVTKIYPGAFASLESLTELTVSQDNEVFYSSENCILEKATNTIVSGCRAGKISAKATSIGLSAFEGCNMKSVTVPEGITSIEAYAFSDCAELHTVKLPNSLERIDEYAFSDCARLPRLTLPQNVTEIGHGFIKNCTALTSLKVDENNLYFYVEGKCLLTRTDKTVIAALPSPKIPEGITAIESHAFDNCFDAWDANEIVLPDTVQRIGNYAFANNSFDSIVIPKSVTEIGTGIFSGCSSLDSIKVDEGNTRYYSDGNCLVDRESNTLIAACCSDAVIPQGVTVIQKAAFQNYSTALIEIPASVQTVEENAFRSMNALQVQYAGSPIMWAALRLQNTGLEDVKITCAQKDSTTLSAANIDGNDTLRLRDAFFALQALQSGTTIDADIDGDGSFTEADAIWILMLCAAE